MGAITFSELATGMFQRYNEGKYQEALDFVNQHAAALPDEAPTITLWRVCLESMNGQAAQAIETLAQAVEQGQWWHPDALTQDPDLAAVQADPRFQSLVRQMQARFEQERQAARPEMLVFKPQSDTPGPYPLLIALHGMGGSIRTTAPWWQPLANQGWLVAVPQSSQIVNLGGYVWDDQARAEAEIAVHLDRLRAEYRIDEQRIVLAGFSQGAGLALRWALEGRFPACGFIAVAPWLEKPEEVTVNPDPHADLPRGYLVTGELDAGHQEVVGVIEDLLHASCISYEREHHMELGHSYPPRFPETIQRAIDFILGE